MNTQYTDPWREVKLVPVKGESCQKHMKRKNPHEYASVQNVHEPVAHIEENAISTEETLPQIVLDDTDDDERENLDVVDLTVQPNAQGSEIFIDLTYQHNYNDENEEMETVTEPAELDDIIIDADFDIPEIPTVDLTIAAEEIPNRIF